MGNESNLQKWVQSVAAGFLCVTAAVTFAIASGHSVQGRAASSASGWVPPSMHEAEAGVDVGPGSDEGLLVSSPMPE